MALTDTADGLDYSCVAHPTQVAGIRRAVSELARRCGACQATLTRIELAVTEAATNVVLHAYRDPGATGRIHVVTRCADGLLGISIRDDGVGMSPNPDSPGLGLGLSLIAHEADRCEVRAASGGGTEVLMSFGVAASAHDRQRLRACDGQAATAGVSAGP